MEKKQKNIKKYPLKLEITVVNSCAMVYNFKSYV